MKRRVAGIQRTMRGTASMVVSNKEFPVYGWLGAGGIAVGMLLIFRHWRPWSDYWFPTVWFGFILLANAIIVHRDGRSLLSSYKREFLFMLPLSAIGWWLFEGANSFVQNWHYLQPYDYPAWWKEIWLAISFSTVIPVEFTMGLLIWRNSWLQRRTGMHPFILSVLGARILSLIGVGCFLLAILYPLYAFPLIWGCLVMILDPINYLAGRPSILGYWARGDWRVTWALYIGGTLCGLLWEFWNYWAFPKWEYTIPWVGFWKVFEMPLLGYLGYGPFAWEVFALFHFAKGLLFHARSRAGLARVGSEGSADGIQAMGLQEDDS